MGKRDKLDGTAIDAFVRDHAGWTVEGGGLVRSFQFDRYGRGLAFVVELGAAAEKQDHHPELVLGYQRVKVTWTTHDAGGITALDAAMAELTDRLAR